MASPICDTSGLIAIIVATTQSSVALYKTVQNFKDYPHSDSLVQLGNELEKFIHALRSLETCARDDPSSLYPLKIVLETCTKACVTLQERIVRNVGHPGSGTINFRTRAKLKHLENDISAFTDMLVRYKNTIVIALGNVNLRSSKVTLQELNGYKDLIQKTNRIFRNHLENVENRLDGIVLSQPYDTTLAREQYGGSDADEHTDAETDTNEAGEEKNPLTMFLPRQETSKVLGSKSECIHADCALRLRSPSQNQSPLRLVKDDESNLEPNRFQQREGPSTWTFSVNNEGFRKNSYFGTKIKKSPSRSNISTDGQQNDGSERVVPGWYHVSSIDGRRDMPGDRSINPAKGIAESFEGCDSDISDLESIMSDAPSLASSLSSVEPIHSTAVTDLKYLLLRHEELEPLYLIAISRVGPERFQKNLRYLLLQYGKALRKEAVNTAQDQAARLVRSAAFKIAFEIKEAMNKDAIPKESSKGHREQLNDFLRNLDRDDEDLSSSGDESLDDRDTNNLQTLESVKNFMISADAFVKLCGEFKHWLNIDDGPKENTADRDSCQAEEEGRCEPQELPVTVDSPLHDPESVPECFFIQEKSQFSLRDSQRKPLHLSQCATEPSYPSLDNWIESISRSLKHVQNVLSDFAQRRVTKGNARISWTCRCGKRLRIEVPRNKEAAGLSFACQAAGPSGTSSISVEIFDDASSVTSSATQTSTEADSSFSSNSPPASSPSAVPSTDSSEQLDPFIPAGTKKYMLLCVNTGMRLIKLANVDVTDVTDAEEMFRRLRMAYCELRGLKGHNPLVKPKSMHYIKFQLLSLLKSKECIGNYQINSIPSRKEILRQEYAFRPCPPLIGDLPIPPAIFMHSFLEPGDHLGPMAIDMLPKKLWLALEFDREGANGNAFDIPTGWGFYIVEEFDWIRIAWCVIVAAVIFSLSAVIWCVIMQDVQGGMGIGQYCIGLLAVGISVMLLVGGASNSSI